MSYFYKDPLAAAWMAKHFGMRFYEGMELDEDGELFEIGQCGILQAADRIAWNGGIAGSTNYYIHPDSLHLLEPQVGDLCFHSYGTSAKGILCWNSGGNPTGGNLEIIQRNGIPLHWPEAEALQ